MSGGQEVQGVLGCGWGVSGQRKRGGGDVRVREREVCAGMLMLEADVTAFEEV